MSNFNFKDSPNKKRLNYTNVTVSNEKIDESSNFQIKTPRTFKPNDQKQSLSQTKNFVPTFEKSNIKGSNTNLNRIIKNKNLKSQSNTSLNNFQNTPLSNSNGSLNKIQRQNINQSSTSLNSIKSARGAPSNQSLNGIQNKSSSNININKNQTAKIKSQNINASVSSINTIKDINLSKQNLNHLKESQSIQSIKSKNSKKSASNLYESIDYSNGQLNEQKKISVKKENNFSFINIWKDQKFLYFSIQEVLLVLNVLSSLTILGLSIWINVDERFKFVSNMSNKLIYSSFNRLIGILPIVCLIISCLALFIDTCYIVLHIFIKSFLNSHDDKQIKRILVNQKTLAKMAETNVTSKLKHLKQRNIIIFKMRKTLRSIRSLTLMNSFVYVFILLGSMFFIGIYLHHLSQIIINYQLSQTLIKLIREYEKQQLSILNNIDTLQVRMRNVVTGTVEEMLVNVLNREFECCHYSNPFQYGDLAPNNCNFNRGCLRPLQEFMWEYLYFSVIVLLSVASFKFCIIFVNIFAFKVVLVNRLFRKLYQVDVRKYRTIYQELNNVDDENLIGVSEDDDDEEDEQVTKERYAKLQEIREKKFEMLQKEEEEEQLRKEKEEMELSKFLENEKRQEAYEIMLLKQKRFEEYRYQQLQRKMQLQHFLDRKENDFKD